MNKQASSRPIAQLRQQQQYRGSLPNRFLSVAEISQTLAPVFQRHGIQRAILFGSRARNDASRRSDIDLLLVQDTDRLFLDRLDGILLQMNRMFAGVSVEAFIYTPQELQRIASQPFIARALREGIVIYEQIRTTTHG
jgi:predicted nucleotidyltransferase